MKRRSGTAIAAQHRHAGAMHHRLQPRGGAKNEQAELLAEDACDPPGTCERYGHCNVHPLPDEE